MPEGLSPDGAYVSVKISPKKEDPVESQSVQDNPEESTEKEPPCETPLSLNTVDTGSFLLHIKNADDQSDSEQDLATPMPVAWTLEEVSEDQGEQEVSLILYFNLEDLNKNTQAVNLSLTLEGSTLLYNQISGTTLTPIAAEKITSCGGGGDDPNPDDDGGDDDGGDGDGGDGDSGDGDSGNGDSGNGDSGNGENTP